MITVDKETRKIEFYKNNESDKIWWVDYIGRRGFQAVSFDKKKILFLFGDYPKKIYKGRKSFI